MKWKAVMACKFLYCRGISHQARAINADVSLLAKVRDPDLKLGLLTDFRTYASEAVSFLKIEQRRHISVRVLIFNFY
jgi:hypothetical protein